MQKPEIQVLTPGIIELEFEFVITSEISPDGFKHAALDEVEMLSSALWHCEESPLNTKNISPVFPSKKICSNVRCSNGETSAS